MSPSDSHTFLIHPGAQAQTSPISCANIKNHVNHALNTQHTTQQAFVQLFSFSEKDCSEYSRKNYFKLSIFKVGMT